MGSEHHFCTILVSFFFWNAGSRAFQKNLQRLDQTNTCNLFDIFWKELQRLDRVQTSWVQNQIYRSKMLIFFLFPFSIITTLPWLIFFFDRSINNFNLWFSNYLHKLISPDPEAWFVGQFAAYLLRPTDDFTKQLERWKQSTKTPYGASKIPNF